MACSMAAADTGIAPAWYAAPTSTRFAIMWSRKSPSASAMASRWTSPPPVRAGDRGEQAVDRREAEPGVGHHRTGGHLARRHDGAAPGPELREVARVGGDQQVEAEVGVGLAGRDRVRRVDAVRAPSFTCETTGPPFWLSPVWSRPRDLAPVEQGGRREHLADRDDAGAADAGEVEVAEPVDGRTRRGVRLGQVVAEHRDLA